MTYSLRRTRDDAGDSGNMSQALFPVYDDDGKIMDMALAWSGCDHAPPEVGTAMRVGSSYARTYSSQDWWQTTMITEILETRETPEGKYVRFKTCNSEYEWRSF